MQLNLASTTSGKVAVTDGTGAPVTWVSRVMMEIDPIEGCETIYFGTNSFTVNISAGDVPVPTPAPTPTPTPTPSPNS